MVDKRVLALEGLVTEGAIQLIRNADRLLLFVRAFLTCLVDPFCFFHLQSSLQPLLSLLLTPAATNSFNLTW